MLQRLAIGLALPLSSVLVAAGLIDLSGAGGTGSNQEGTEITGVPLTCPDGSQVLSSFTLAGGSFHVVGEIVGDAEGSLVVLGPTGEVELTAQADTEIDGALTVGDIVEAEGVIVDPMDYVAERITHACEVVPVATDAPPTDTLTPMPSPTQTPEPAIAEASDPGHVACSEATEHALERLHELQEDGKPVDRAIAAIEACGTGSLLGESTDRVSETAKDRDCPPGHQARGQLRVKTDGEVKVDRGAVIQSSDGSLTIDTPMGPLSVTVGGDTDVKGDLQRAGVIKLEGALSGEGSVQADEVKVLCPDDHDDDNDDDDDDDDD